MSKIQDPMDDIILSGLDQYLPQVEVQKRVLETLEERVRLAVSQRDLETLEKIGRTLIGVSQVGGVGFAQFVWKIYQSWETIKQGTYNFFEWAEEKFGKNKTTIVRNLRVWEMLISDDIPKEYRSRFQLMPIRVLIPIANMWKQGWEVTNSQWSQLANAPDSVTVNRIIREIKNKPPKKDSLQIEWYPEKKEIIMWRNGRPHYVYLTFDDSDSVIQAGLSRLFSDKALEK